MKKMFLILELLFSAALLAQQPVAVTGTVTGANGAVYSNGTYQIQLVDSTGAPLQSFQVGGGTQTQTQFSETLSGTGTLAMSLYANTDIGPPAGTQWRFNICSLNPTLNLPLIVTARVCFSQPLTISGAGDVSTALSASAPALYTLNPTTGVSSAIVRYITGTTIASGLPAAAKARNQFWGITDGASATDCSTGSETTAVVCESNGTTWTAVGGTGGGSGITQATGDITAGPGSGSQVFTLPIVNGNVGTCGDATHVGQVTLNAKGLATACGAVAISPTPGTTTSAATFNNSGSGAASGTTFNGSAPQTISYNTVGAQPVLPSNVQTSLFQQFGSSPIIAKGATYDTIVANALAAPGFCVDSANSRVVQTASIWNIANSKWYSVFFTTPSVNNLATPTFVTGSLRAPGGSDYILGNGDLDCGWQGTTYTFVYAHYPSAGTPAVSVDTTSTNTLAAASWSTDIATLCSNCIDAGFARNPTSGKQEIWTITNTTTHAVSLFDRSTTGAFTNEGVQFTIPLSLNGAPGEFHVFYIGTQRWAAADLTQAPTATSARYRYLYYNTTGTTWVYAGIEVLPQPVNAAQNTQCFDGKVLVMDTLDGNGSVPRALYACGDNASGTDNTDSNIYLANGFNMAPPFSMATSPASIVVGNGYTGASRTEWIDEANHRIGINQPNPAELVDVWPDAATNGGYRCLAPSGGNCWFNFKEATLNGYFAQIGAVNSFFSPGTVGTMIIQAPTGTGIMLGTAASATPLINITAARKSTFVCTGGGTITISNAATAVLSDIPITLNTVGGTITTAPVMMTKTATTGFTVLCGATDTSTYNYIILN